MNFVFFVFIFGAGFVTAENSPRLFLPDYRDHPCIRSCEDGGKPMRCEYFFTVEWYHTLTKACYDCPFNKTDCYRPHCVPADGAPRAVLVINRLLPGPAIQVCEGDEVVVTLKNKLGMAEGTTIHWHGIHQKGTQYMDGVEMLTQCPVPAYSKFEYKFKADTPGTHFWHSHAGLQRSDGMFGAFVVRQSPSADRHYQLYDYDLPEHYILISDWLTETTISKFTHHHHDDGDNKPKSMLVNGMGTFQNYTDKATGAVFNTPHAEFYVQQGKRYRFRIMSNGILNCPIMFSIDNHMLTVIASDGAPFEPFTVDSVVVFAGERFDFILTANETVANYWIRLQGLADCGASFSRSKQTAILRYNGAPAEEVPPGDTDFFSNAREGKQLNPLNSRETPNKIPIARMNASFPEDDVSGIPDKKFYVAMDFYKINNKYFHDSEFYPVYAVERNEKLFTPQMNRISMTLPPSPPLSQLDDLPPEQFCNAETVKGNCTEEHCECTHVLKVDLGDLVELVLLDEGVVFNANHPTHLHGYAFRVVGMDRLGEWTSLEEIKRLDEEGKLPRNLVSPPMKDSVTVPDGGYTIIRFNANNPGFWLMHCHIAFHVEIGMALVIQVGDKKDFPKVPKNFPRCGDYHFEEHDVDTKPDKCVVISKQTSLSCSVITLGILTLLSTLGLLLL